MNISVTTRNLFRLLRSGAFGQTEAIEPLSVWKWGQLQKMAVSHGIAALVYDGLVNCSNQFFATIPQKQMDQWKQAAEATENTNRKYNVALSNLFPKLMNELTRPILVSGQALGILYNNPLHRSANRISLYFPYETKAKKADEWIKQNATPPIDHERNTLSYTWMEAKAENRHRLVSMANTLNNRTLQHIIEEDFCASTPTYFNINGTRVETLSPTLQLLIIIVDMAQGMMNEGFKAKQLTDMGVFLRKAGDKVDYVKLHNWTDRLSLTAFVQVEGTMLMTLLGFEAEELPFMDETIDINGILKKELAWQPDTTQWRIKRSARYFRYYPGESVAGLLNSFAHTLSQVEE